MCYYWESKREVLKRTMVSVLFFAALFVSNETLSAQKNQADSIEEIGKRLSELLISRGDISKTPLAIRIDRLFPDEDFSEFEDSPAMVILSMLYGAQLLLPQSWEKLLSQADSLNVNENMRYLETHFIQRANDSFVLTCVLKQSSKYYTFSAGVLCWGEDKYVMRIYKKMKEYNSKKELKKNLFSIVIGEEEEDLNEDTTHEPCILMQ